ncbi:uncharacterized protein [Spinacia oleracea]|uniref:Retrotransposon Copia-like N-terminal domain-containing protein n=1 Tax=Spinacia oleracea TaxID=3562 RepID=A0A9R0HTS6_SPIOL|nr:uncharacterized protein LOC110776587 [Spinacia oleracea]
MATQNLAPNQDHASPFYLHPTDNTASQLVSVKFKGEGYGDWKKSMMISMSSKNKLGFVNVTIEKPKPTHPSYQAWMRCNDMMISWILFNLDATISKSVLPQLFSLEQQAAEITQGGQNVAEFFTEIKSIWDKISAANPFPTCTCNLCACNLTQKIFKMQQEQRLMQFLMKLAEHLSVTRGSLLMMHPLPTISHAYRMLAQEERQRGIAAHVQQHESHAFGADRRRYNDYQNIGNHNSYRGQQFGAKNTYQYNKPTGNKRPSIYYCDHCKVNGHSTERCFKSHGFPPGFTGYKRDKRAAVENYSDEADQCTQILNLLNKQQNDKPKPPEAHEEGDVSGHAFMAGNTFCFLTCSKSNWLLDSGASDHMCASLGMFDTYEAVINDNDFITIPDGRE